MWKLKYNYVLNFPIWKKQAEGGKVVLFARLVYFFLVISISRLRRLLKIEGFKQMSLSKSCTTEIINCIFATCPVTHI